MADKYPRTDVIHVALGLPLGRAGALDITWNDAEEAALPDLMAKARENACSDVASLRALSLWITRVQPVDEKPGLRPPVGFKQWRRV
jgi:hypothetical protein